MALLRLAKLVLPDCLLGLTAQHTQPRLGLLVFADAARRACTSPPACHPSFCTAAPSLSGISESSLEEIRSRIFGTHIGNGLRSGRKVLRRKLVGEQLANYYLPSIKQNDPFYVDQDADRGAVRRRRKAKLERLKRRGKAPPKKGQGKRSSRK